jgi:hypothetical protein
MHPNATAAFLEMAFAACRELGSKSAAAPVVKALARLNLVFQ